MTPEELSVHLDSLSAAADVVDSIDHPTIQQMKNWDLTGWGYELIPWGVRFLYHGEVEMTVTMRPCSHRSTVIHSNWRVRPTTDPAKQHPLCILAVDDCEDTCASFQELLPLWGYDCRSVNNGWAAVEMTKSWQPDVILLDIVLPDIDGLEVLRTIRNLKQKYRPSVFCYSGRDDDQIRTQARIAGCDRFLAKPIAPETLKELLQSFDAIRRQQFLMPA